MEFTEHSHTRFRIAALLILIQTMLLSNALQVDLLNSEKQETLNWITYTTGDSSIPRAGWREASYTNTRGDVFRVYTVCNVEATDISNWLRTPYISTNDVTSARSDVISRRTRFYVEMKFTMRKCTKYPDPERLQQCKESFKLLVYPAQSDFANDMMPTWDEATYTGISVVAADRVFTDTDSAIINVETRSVTQPSLGGAYFAFYDQGACVTLLGVRVYQIVCPSVTYNLAEYNTTSTGEELTSVVQARGRCVQNAGFDSEGGQGPSYLCKADGTWSFPTGGCVCMPGYQPDQTNSSCLPCPIQTYKSDKSNSRCFSCPPYSQATSVGSTSCACVTGYFRASTDDLNSPCTKPPGGPVENMNAARYNDSVISLTWIPPADKGGRTDLVYQVTCEPSDTVIKFYPSSTSLTDPWVMVFGLRSDAVYKFSVIVENGVSRESGVEKRASVTVSPHSIGEATNSPISGGVRLNLVTSGQNSVTLSWTLSSGYSGSKVGDLVYWKTSAQDGNTTIVLPDNVSIFTVHSLSVDTTYTFIARLRTLQGSLINSDALSVRTLSDSGTTSDTSGSHNMIAIAVGCALAITLCILLGFIALVYSVKRITSRKAPTVYSNGSSIHDTALCSQLMGRSLMNNNCGASLSSATDGSGSSRSYMDPHTYEDPSQAVREFTKELDLGLILIESIIGGGEFGDVCRGRLRQFGGMDQIVAIKTLKQGETEHNRYNFLAEASIMGQFDDPNVVRLIGVVTRTEPLMIVTEFMQNGSLDKFLRGNDGVLTVLQLIGMLRGIASGMAYLCRIGFVHRDLAARNILVNESLICKVSDFGLSRELPSDSSTISSLPSSTGKVPIRWTAPEAIRHSQYTNSSDVWSYGVLAWEVMTYGSWPYGSWSNRDVIRAIETGYRLPAPLDCPEPIYRLMLDTWTLDRTSRPKFLQIVHTLDRLIREPQLLRTASMQILANHNQLASSAEFI